jgi:hypothetical protein
VCRNGLLPTSRQWHPRRCSKHQGHDYFNALIRNQIMPRLLSSRSTPQSAWAACAPSSEPRSDQLGHGSTQKVHCRPRGLPNLFFEPRFRSGSGIDGSTSREVHTTLIGLLLTLVPCVVRLGTQCSQNMLRLCQGLYASQQEWAFPIHTSAGRAAAWPYVAALCPVVKSIDSVK